MIEKVKSYFLDDEFSWKDVLATFIGCVLVLGRRSRCIV